jgi:hypothetical protein
MLTCPGIAERYVTSGDVLMVYSTGFARICVSDALPNMTDEIVSDSFYLPGNTSALIVARGGNIQVAAVNPAAIVSVYFTVVERWLSLAREVKFEDG